MPFVLVLIQLNLVVDPEQPYSFNYAYLDKEFFNVISSPALILVDSMSATRNVISF